MRLCSSGCRGVLTKVNTKGDAVEVETLDNVYRGKDGRLSKDVDRS